ncbi:MAG: ATP-binding protein [Clostridiales bacterium]|jgi:AAA+ ATPase superfamily predicted ATPase|nr:ATP-binding protein [Clostridiales bacterium]
MFVGRLTELNALNKAYKRDGFQFAVVYGRRRVGKTALVNEFIRNKRAVYFSAVESTIESNIAQLSEQILSVLTPSAPRNPFATFGDAVQFCFEQARNRRIVVVIDEYPYLAESDRSVSSVLQNAIDKWQGKSQLFLILCGSSMSFMENQVMGYKSPLYGRRTSQLKVLPFDYFDSAKMYPTFGDEDKIALYAITGGVPEYASRLDASLSVRDNLLDLLFDQSGRLFEEPSNLLKQELKSPQTYNAIIAAIASGHTRLGEIATAANIETSQCSNMLKILISLGLVKKELPAVNPNARKSIYVLADQMFRFWYRFVLPNKSRILAGVGDTVCDEVLSEHLSAFLGYTFEECAKQYMWRVLRSKSSPVNFREVGRWWGGSRVERREEEIDFVAWNDASAIFGECKWRNAPTGVDVLDGLIYRSENFEQFDEKHFWLFSKSGYTDALKDRAAALRNVHLVELPDMFE